MPSKTGNLRTVRRLPNNIRDSFIKKIKIHLSTSGLMAEISWLTYSSQNRWLIDSALWKISQYMQKALTAASDLDNWESVLIRSVFSWLCIQIPSDSQHTQPGWGVEVTVPFSHTHKLNIDDFQSCYWFLRPSVCSSHSSREALRRHDCTWYLQNRFFFLP